MSDINHTQTFTEEDMSKVRSLFARGADAIVSASQLATEVQELKNTMSELKQSYEEVVANNRFLVRQINALETELTEAKKERDEAKLEVSHFNQKLAGRDHEIQELQTSHNEQVETIARLRKESDDHMMRALKAEESFDNVKAKFHGIRDAFKDMGDVLSEVDEVLYPKAETFLQPPSYEALPEGVTAVPLEEEKLADLHNTIAEAVGEPTIPPTSEEGKPEEDSGSYPWKHGFAAVS